MTLAFPACSQTFSLQQNGQEGSKGSSRRPKEGHEGDEGNEGQEGINTKLTLVMGRSVLDRL